MASEDAGNGAIVWSKAEQRPCTGQPYSPIQQRRAGLESLYVGRARCTGCCSGWRLGIGLRTCTSGSSGKISIKEGDVCHPCPEVAGDEISCRHEKRGSLSRLPLLHGALHS